MSFIDIHTNNMSRELRDNATFVDNWAYVPGISRTGDPDQLYAFRSLEDFKDTCGIGSPEGSHTYEYVCGLLNAGIPVLFRRIAYNGQFTASTKKEADELRKTSGVIAAEGVFTYRDETTDTAVDYAKIQEKFGGSYGNDLSVSIRQIGTSYWVEVALKGSVVEKQKICKIVTGEAPEETTKRAIEGLQTVKFDRIVIDVSVTDPTQFQIKDGTSVQLKGGLDRTEQFTDEIIRQEIAASYKELTDKILYQPKFITSGGFVDSEEMVGVEGSISYEMRQLTLIRQDCRALIDLPLTTVLEDYNVYAEKLAYTQSSDSQAIPSVSMCAPWCYMQIGNSQEWMPPSYVYLTVVGNSLSKGGKVYTPKAGLANGRISNIIRPQFEVGSSQVDKWQQDGVANINPITRLQSGNYIIAGNSTLLIIDEDESNAFSESSADLTVIEIRRKVYNLAQELQYQYNSADAFETFALRTSDFLDVMKSEGAVTDYDIINITSNSDPRTLKIKLDIYLTPTIKNIEIFLNVSYGSVEVSTGGEN